MTGTDARSEGLVEQRDHLLRSLDDLEAEHAAGDLGDEDFRALEADYTTRAAAVIRALETSGPSVTTATSAADPPGRSWPRTAAWVIGLAAMGVIAGLLLARFSGSRGAGDTVTGDIRTSIREQLFDAQQVFATGDLTGAIVIYDEVLEQQPSNAEALAYKGWFVNLGGDPAAARELVEESVAFDPAYADARVFAASLALEQGDPEAAQEHLVAFDRLDATPFVEELVTDFRLRERVAAALDPDAPEARRAAALGRVGPLLLIDDPPPFAATGLTVDDVVLSVEALLDRGDALEALMLADLVLTERPDDVDLLASRGWLMGRLPDDELRQSGLVSLDRALELQAGHPEARVFRAAVRTRLGDLDGARADLSVFDGRDEQPAELVELIEDLGLRALLRR